MIYIGRIAGPIAASAFNQLGQYGNRAYYYAELAVSSLAMAETIASTHCAYPRRDGHAEYAWVAWLSTKMVYPRTVTHPSTNRARRRATTLIGANALPLSQTASYMVCLEALCRFLIPSLATGLHILLKYYVFSCWNTTHLACIGN